MDCNRKKNSSPPRPPRNAKKKPRKRILKQTLRSFAVFAVKKIMPASQEGLKNYT